MHVWPSTAPVMLVCSAFSLHPPCHYRSHLKSTHYISGGLVDTNARAKTPTLARRNPARWTDFVTQVETAQPDRNTGTKIKKGETKRNIKGLYVPVLCKRVSSSHSRLSPHPHGLDPIAGARPLSLQHTHRHVKEYCSRALFHNPPTPHVRPHMHMVRG